MSCFFCFFSMPDLQIHSFLDFICLPVTSWAHSACTVPILNSGLTHSASTFSFSNKLLVTSPCSSSIFGFKTLLKPYTWSVIEFLLVFIDTLRFSSTVARKEKKQLVKIVQTAHKISDTSCPWPSVHCIQRGWDGHLAQQVLIAAFSCLNNRIVKEHKQQGGWHSAGSE